MIDFPLKQYGLFCRFRRFISKFIRKWILRTVQRKRRNKTRIVPAEILVEPRFCGSVVAAGRETAIPCKVIITLIPPGKPKGSYAFAVGTKKQLTYRRVVRTECKSLLPVIAAAEKEVFVACKYFRHSAKF